MSRARNPALQQYPIKYWSHSSLMAYLRNPLAWYKRYVEHVYDTPTNPASIVGRAGHIALQHFYGGISKEGAVDLGLEYLRSVADFEINFGKAKSKAARKEKRLSIERDYLQAIGFYLAKPPRYSVQGIEVKAMGSVPGVPLPIKAVSDLVVDSRVERGALDIVDHKFVDVFSPGGSYKTLFVMQALFNYYTVTQTFNKPVKRFIFHECKKRKNADGRSQMRRHVIDFESRNEEFAVFNRLLREATEDIRGRRVFLPNPSDMFEGENSFEVYRLGLQKSGSVNAKEPDLLDLGSDASML